MRKSRHDAIAAYAAEFAGTTLDRAKLAKKIGALTDEILEEVALGLKAAMDLD